MPTHASASANLSIEKRVGQAAVRAWRIAGEDSRLVAWSALADQVGRSVADTALGSVVFVPRLRQIECVLATDERWEVAREAIQVLADRGWVVNALVPLRTLGIAHDIFRGLPLRLQGWWERDDRDLAFTAPEIA